MNETGQLTNEVIALEQKYVLQTYRRPDFVLARGQGVWLYDTDGRAYLDGVAGIAVNALGYGDAQLVAAIKAAAEGLVHVSNLYHSAPQAQLARSLVERSFADRVFFCNSGTEANEAALKFARKYARQKFGEHKTEIVAFTGSFHGRTMGALSVTANEKYRTPFEPLVPGVHFVPFNDLAAAEQAINDEVCAVIVEPVQGEGGVHVAQPEFLAGLRAACDRSHALLIFDEVQCGMGRTGQLWAHQAYDVVPDLMTLAKPLAGGLPMGAVLLTQAVADVIGPGDHGSTFAAGPFVCQVARQVLERVAQPDFLGAVRAKGQHMAARLQSLASQSGLVREVRGRGLIWGIECTQDVAPIIAAGFRRGILVCNAGPTVLRLVPPLVITPEEIDVLVERLTAAVHEVEQSN